jgi:hypothetical protein
VADVIYGIHRCSHGHGDELPAGFDLIQDASAEPRHTQIGISIEGAVQLSDRMIFGLLAVAILSPENADQRVPDGYHLDYSTTTRLEINEWWAGPPTSRPFWPQIRRRLG